MVTSTASIPIYHRNLMGTIENYDGEVKYTASLVGLNFNLLLGFVNAPVVALASKIFLCNFVCVRDLTMVVSKEKTPSPNSNGS
ncbi:MAG: hypothetical protein SAL07_06435 [Oscillatoria sp. PMC 1051.18]|nr:hypothetical protein [Oscillatoria sp. PMC 1050.18]MEC5029532.1 hypothetical protein [Oscillatoria sp. PMC 1051.18]